MKAKKEQSELTNKMLRHCVEKSAAVILSFQHKSGAYPASPYFKVYNFSWIRDGAFIADSMSRAGYVESAEKFFSWCSDIINERRDYILHGGSLDARYTLDGKESTDRWETFQLDGYGTLLWAIKQHETRHNRDITQFKEATGLVQHYLATKWRDPCYDWWEERKGYHAASLACIYAGLEAFEHPEAPLVKASINLDQERTDASLLICALFDAVDTTTFAPVLEKIEAELCASDGGVYRYKEDRYYGGGAWPVVTNLLGWYYCKLGRFTDAVQKLHWNLDLMQPNGWMPEQSQKHLLYPEYYKQWQDKWGAPACPLLWSQAKLITLAHEVKKP